MYTETVIPVFVRPNEVHILGALTGRVPCSEQDQTLDESAFGFQPVLRNNIA